MLKYILGFEWLFVLMEIILGFLLSICILQLVTPRVHFRAKRIKKALTKIKEESGG